MKTTTLIRHTAQNIWSLLVPYDMALTNDRETAQKVSTALFIVPHKRRKYPALNSLRNLLPDIHGTAGDETTEKVCSMIKTLEHLMRCGIIEECVKVEQSLLDSEQATNGTIKVSFMHELCNEAIQTAAKFDDQSHIAIEPMTKLIGGVNAYYGKPNPATAEAVQNILDYTLMLNA